MNNFPKDGFVKLPDVLKFLGIKRTTFLDGINNGTIPITKIRLSKRSIGYSAEEVRQYANDLIDSAKEKNEVPSHAA